MPILVAEPELHPPTLFESSTGTGNWTVALTRPRQEKCLARALLHAGIGFFFPCTPRRNRIRNRIVVSRIPLFAGYVFVTGTVADRPRMLATGRVVRLLPVPDQQRLHADLMQVWQLTGTGLTLAPADRIDAGTRVRIRDGPMAGLNGRVIRTAGGKRFVVAVDFLGRGVSVDVESEMLVRLPSRKPALTSNSGAK